MLPAAKYRHILLFIQDKIVDCGYPVIYINICIHLFTHSGLCRNRTSTYHLDVNLSCLAPFWSTQVLDIYRLHLTDPTWLNWAGLDSVPQNQVDPWRPLIQIQWIRRTIHSAAKTDLPWMGDLLYYTQTQTHSNCVSELHISFKNNSLAGFINWAWMTKLNLIADAATRKRSLSSRPSIRVFNP